MISCREFVELLIDFLDGELPEERRLIIEYHIRKCPPCNAYLETYKTTIRLTRSLPCAPPPPELWERLRAAMREEGMT